MDRRVLLRGTVNFRDFGGYTTSDGRRIRSGVLFRSDNLSRLAADEHDRFRALGIRTLVDLRTENERSTKWPAGANRLPAPSRSSELSVEHLPISIVQELEKRWTLRERIGFVLGGHLQRLDAERLQAAYRALPDHAAGPLRRLFALLRDRSRTPLLVMCMGGKDRTGFCVAMVLTALGVSFETVLEDYHLTNVYAADRIDRILRAIELFSMKTVREVTLRPFLEARREYLVAAFDRVRESHGSVEAYLERAVGLRPAARASLRDQLLL